MSKIKDFDDVLEEEDAGEEIVKKKEKKKKSKEERGRDRKVVFFVFILVVIVTLGFWFKAMMSGEGTKTQKIENLKKQNNEVIDEDSREEKGFFVRYRI